MTPLIQKEDEKLHGMWGGESRWIMNYKCITNEPSRGLRTARPAQSITALTRQWAACCRFQEKDSRAANSTLRGEWHANTHSYIKMRYKGEAAWRGCLCVGVFVVWLCEVITSLWTSLQMCFCSCSTAVTRELATTLVQFLKCIWWTVILWMNHLVWSWV